MWNVPAVGRWQWKGGIRNESGVLRCGRQEARRTSGQKSAKAVSLARRGKESGTIVDAENTISSQRGNHHHVRRVEQTLGAILSELDDRFDRECGPMTIFEGASVPEPPRGPG